MSELGKRIITSLVLIAIVLNCLFIGNISWIVLLIIISLISWSEFFALIKKIYKSKFLLIFSTIISTSLLFLFLYIAYDTKIDHGEFVILFVLLVCIFSDIGGYIIGKSIGGKKLTKISPNKTISGTIGSLLFSFFPIGIYTILFKTTENDSFGFAIESDAIIVCLSLSLACQLGDLIISYFKRLAKVKDTGNILPGHGGILDRIDGIIFAVLSLPVLNYFI